MNKFIVVLGCHRSGTSAVAGLLHLSGVHMTEKILQDYANPKGYFENKEIQNLNREILTWLEKHNPPNNWTFSSSVETFETYQGFDAEIEKTINNYKKRYSLFGWKDPRFCLTFPLWMRNKVLWDVIVCLRYPEEVIASLSKSPYNLDSKTALNIWKEYNKRILVYLERYSLNKYHLVQYEKLIEEPLKEYLQLTSFLSISPSKQGKEFIEKDLRHHEIVEFPDAESKEIYYKIKSFFDET